MRELKIPRGKIMGRRELPQPTYDDREDRPHNENMAIVIEGLRKRREAKPA